MNKIVLFLFTVTVFGCQSPDSYLGKDSIDIYIENQTSGNLTAVKVFVIQSTLINGKYVDIHTDSSHIGTINSLKTATGTLHEKNIQGVDGSYLFTATDQTGKKYSKRFGYLTNGSFLETKYHVLVKSDTILFRR